MQTGLEDPAFRPNRARSHSISDAYQARSQSDAHQLHPGGRFYPEQSPAMEHATMSGGLGITANDLHHFDRPDESPVLSSRYQRQVVEDSNGSSGASA